jgi:Leucine-rich repeat (LRR) protein
MSVIVTLDSTYSSNSLLQFRTKIPTIECKEITVSSMKELMDLKDRNAVTCITLDTVTEITFIIEWFPNLLQLTITNSNIKSDLSRFCLRRCQKLDCFNNKLTSLPELPACQTLQCSYNSLTSLPELPACKVLRCSDNSLTSLPELPACKELDCPINKLTSLPELPACKVLQCSYNSLTSLPELPACKVLDCSNNKIISLPKLHPSCKVHK